MLSEPITNLKGVGEKVQEELEVMHIHTMEDLLYYFPYRYDVFELKPLSELIHEDKVTIMGRVAHEPSLTFFGRKKSRLFFNVMVEHVAVKAVMFNRAFAKKHINQGDLVTLTGKWDAHRLQITVDQYKVGPVNADDKIKPIYSVKGKMTNYRLRKIIKQAIADYGDDVDERLPEHILIDYKLPNLTEALKTMHFPPNRIALKHARRRFTYEEFLLFQLKIQLLRHLNRDAQEGRAQHYDAQKVQQFVQNLPFQLTNAQQKSLNQILSDLKAPYRMNRLLQGDVGSGKTVVAAISLYASITAKRQGALMVPTEILAEQHYQSLKSLFNGRVTIALLTGSVKGKKREAILSAVQNHDIDIVIGTHALIQDDVVFHNLGLAIIDEQHRFGVKQRRLLKEKGELADVLFMTATPIPRTLAITAFGDMDVSIINEMPAGRKEIETYWVKENMLEHTLDFIQRKINQGEQAYLICPLIEESDKLDIQNAVDLYHQLKTYYPSEIKVGLMHGRLPSDEKDAVMKAFVKNEIQVLVSTTVIEVGVNVPNATVMVIYDAERFGLAQLHQLRGRVGRGSIESFCILIAEPKGEIGKERMRIMTETTDGFQLAEEDLKLRGPGDFFGKKQSGLPEFKVADMVHDYRALETARQDANQLIEHQIIFKNPEYKALLHYLESEGIFTKPLD
ncbi:MAG TPA: ATP-dependent DNA helicase RecG [Cerasibacillus sp.]|uniref:ATP-dependent DNA helicase RecG n=1 Tax=Cerasibacillus sp. TaxID=2498711 RepID=UPI002F3FAB9D